MSNVDESKGESKQNQHEEAQGLREIVRALVFCGLIVLAIRSFVFEPFKIPSSSMVPTLRVGDHIFVSKFDYGLSLPFSKIEFVRWSAPQRGDVIVFLYPKDESLHYIKRVVGVPGDKIVFKGRDLYINDELVKREPILETEMGELASLVNEEESGEIFKEFLPEKTHLVRYLKKSELGFTETTQTEIVPPDKFFVVGDNRDRSYDSRSWGYVARENIKGKARMIWISLDQGGDWLAVGRVRWSRSGMIIN